MSTGRRALSVLDVKFSFFSFNLKRSSQFSIFKRRQSFLASIFNNKTKKSLVEKKSAAGRASLNKTARAAALRLVEKNSASGRSAPRLIK
jgi:hypothetical protein